MPPDAPARCWRLRRPCRLPPARLLALGALAPALSLPPALVFFALGYTTPLVFALASVLLVGLLLLLYCVHAIDGEDVRVERGRVHVTEAHGWRSCSRDWPASQVRVLSVSPQGVEVRLDARVVLQLGREVADDERRRFAHELRQALSGA